MAYVEPFAGMLGVLLQRPRAAVEIANDADENIVTWWRAVRDDPDGLARLVACTPWSRVEFHAARARVADPETPFLERAAAVHTVLRQSMLPGLNKSNTWLRSTAMSANIRRSAFKDADEIALLAQRIHRVQLECMDGVRLLEQISGDEHAVVYVDPPYRNDTGTSDNSPYGADADYDALDAALRAQRGRVAISGYGHDWDALGWERREHRSYFAGPTLNADTSRTEVLWCNFATDRQPTLL